MEGTLQYEEQYPERSFCVVGNLLSHTRSKPFPKMFLFEEQDQIGRVFAAQEACEEFLQV